MPDAALKRLWHALIGVPEVFMPTPGSKARLQAVVCGVAAPMVLSRVLEDFTDH